MNILKISKSLFLFGLCDKIYILGYKGKMKVKNMKLVRFALIISIALLINVVILIGGVYGDVTGGDIEWVDPQNVTLGLAENFTRDNFIIEATDFYDDVNNGSAVITVYGTTNGTASGIISQTIAREGDSWNVTDSANITTMNIEIENLKEIKGNISANEGVNVIVDERVKIRTMLAGKPAPVLSVFPMERKINNRTFVDRIFSPGSEISINFSITNEGKAALRNVTLIVNGNNESELPLLLSGDSLKYELPDLKANDTNIINVRFRAPSVGKRNFTIFAIVTGNDVFGRAYNATDSTHITVRPFADKMIEVKKYLPEKIYMGDFAYVSLYINNNWGINVSGINLTEDIPEGFERLDDLYSRNLTNFTLRPYESRFVEYKLRPKKPGIYTFPAGSSIVEWGYGAGYGAGVEGGIEYNNKSNILIVNGPYVELRKTGTIKGDNIVIKIDARNIGDMTAIVRLRDTFSKNGTAVKSLVVRPSSTASFSYNINRSNVTISDGEVILPHANAVVFDQFLYSNDRYAQRIVSNDLVLNMTK